MNKNNNSKDALFLSIVKIFTLGVGTISTMILSKKLSLDSYGTYSTLNLLATSGAAISVLGLADAMNYFYNKEKDIEKQRKYVNNILLFQTVIGIITGIIILVGEPVFITYFNNPFLKGMCIYIAFRPFLDNIIISLQNLQVAIGRAKQIAIRNAIFSGMKVLTIILCVMFFKDIRIILFAIIFMDLLTVLYFWITFSKVKFPINIMKFDIELTREILYFSIPMGIYVMSNMLMREFDKYVIGYFESTAMLAIYTNCSTTLPLDIITNSFLIVIIPIMTRLISNKEYEKAQQLFSNYLMIGVYSTVVFGIALILTAKEAISFLYDDKYLIGKPVFILYIIVSMIRFANLTLVLSAKGKTKTLMKVSIISLIINSFTSIILYKLFGFIGPAIATVMVTLISTLVMCNSSCKVLKTTLLKIISWKDISAFVVELFLCVNVFTFMKNQLYILNINKYIILFICAGGFSFLMLIINYKKIERILKNINLYK